MTRQSGSQSSRAVGVAPVVRVVAPLQLLAQAIPIALRSRGLVVVVDPDGSGGLGQQFPQVLLLINDLASPNDVRNSRRTISASGCPVLVLTSRERDLYWGPLLAAGAARVLPATASIDEVEAAIRGVWDDPEPTESEEHARLIREWQRFRCEHHEFTARMSLLSSPERTVLTGLCGGFGIAELAAELGVAETMVRSEVKSMLRKLSVRSQLAAVALVRRHGCPIMSALTLAGMPGEGQPGSAQPRVAP